MRAQLPGRYALVVAIASLLLLGPGARRVAAHAGRTPLALWGAFPADVARCQRVIGEAALFYGSRAVSARSLCQSREIAGIACDSNATDTAIREARNHALDEVDAHCNDRVSGTLGFLGVLEVQADITTSCQQLQDSVTSAVFTPVPVPGGGSFSGVAQACVLATARAAPKLARFALRVWQTTFDRIASSSYSVRRKQAMVEAARRRITQATARLVTEIGQPCPAANFLVTYQQDVSVFLNKLAARADCVVGGVYAQDTVVCPPPGQ